jgi:hypothetical protein
MLYAYFNPGSNGYVLAKLDKLRKGEACARPEDEGNSEERLPLGLLRSTVLQEKD